MVKLKRSAKIEIAVVIFLALLIVILWTAALGNDTLDITLHDTYFVIKNTKEKVFVFPVLLLVTVVYLVKEAFYGYKRTFQNMVLLTSLFLINICLLLGVKFAAIILPHASGWTIYPPLSALPKALPPSPLIHSSLFRDIWQILLLIQILFLLILVIIAVITGKNWNIDRRGNQMH